MRWMIMARPTAPAVSGVCFGRITAANGEASLRRACFGPSGVAVAPGSALLVTGSVSGSQGGRPSLPRLGLADGPTPVSVCLGDF